MQLFMSCTPYNFFYFHDASSGSPGLGLFPLDAETTLSSSTISHIIVANACLISVHPIVYTSARGSRQDAAIFDRQS